MTFVFPSINQSPCQFREHFEKPAKRGILGVEPVGNLPNMGKNYQIGLED